MEAVTTALTTAIGFVGTVLETITTNAIFCVIFAGGTILPLAVRCFRKIRRAAR